MGKLFFALIFTFFNFPGTGPLYEAYRNAAEKNLEAELGKGELKEIEIAGEKEYFQFTPENANSPYFVVFSTALGRYDPFDYMIIVNKAFEIINIRVLKYRSDYGYEVANKGWLKQFYVKPSEKFVYRKNIDALSGATYSAPSLVNDVNLIIDHLKNP